MKIRLIGEPEQVTEATQIIRDTFTVTAFSGPRPCRGSATHIRLYLEVTPMTYRPAHEPGPGHPNAPIPGDDPVTCWWCDGDGCPSCGGSGLVPAWIYED